MYRLMSVNTISDTYSSFLLTVVITVFCIEYVKDYAAGVHQVQ